MKKFRNLLLGLTALCASFVMTSCKPKECEHEFGAWAVTTAATHTTAGEEERTCSKCGEKETQAIPADANAHEWGQGVVTTPATCSEAGVMTFTCACGQTKTEPIGKLNHVEGQEVKFNFHYTLKEGETFGPELKTAEDVKGVFIANGYEGFEVSGFSKVYGQAQSGQNYNTYDVLKFGTGSAKGTLTITLNDYVTKATVKAAAWTATDSLTINGENKAITNVLDGTLTFADYEFTFAQPTKVIAIETNKRIIVSEIKFEVANITNYTDATCTTAGGYDVNHVCTVCGGTITEPTHVEIPAKGHNYGELIAEVPAKCNATGTVAHYHCDVCNKDFNADKTAELTAEQLVIAIDPTAHNYGELVAEVPATCTANGTKAHFVCAHCNQWFDAEKVAHEAEWFVIQSAGGEHSLGEEQPALAPTCTEVGHTAYQECSICHAKVGYEEIPALGHHYAPVEGQEWMQCNRQGCGHEAFSGYLEVDANDIKDGMKFIFGYNDGGTKYYAGAITGTNKFFSRVTALDDALVFELKASANEGCFYVMNNGKYLIVDTSGNNKLSWGDTPCDWKVVLFNEVHVLQAANGEGSCQIRYNGGNSRFSNYGTGSSSPVCQVLVNKEIDLVDITELNVTIEGNENLTKVYSLANDNKTFKIAVACTPNNANEGYKVVIPEEYKDYLKYENGTFTVLKLDEEQKDVSFKVIGNKGLVEKTVTVKLAAITKYTVTITGADNVDIEGVEAGKVNEKTSLKFTVTPKEGYELVSVSMGGSARTPDAQGFYNWTVNSDTEIVIVANKLEKYTITVVAENATVSIETGEFYEKQPVEFRVTPADEYAIQSVKLGEVELIASEGKYTFTPTANATLTVTTVSANTEYDITLAAAVENGTVTGITYGTPEKKKAGETFSFTVVAAYGYEVKSVKAGETTLTANENVYSFEVAGNTVITIVIEEFVIKTYTKVTSAEQLTEGQYLLVYEKDGKAYIFNGQDAVNGYILVDLSNGAIISTEAVDNVALTLTINGDKFNILMGNGKYINYTSGSNGLGSGGTAPADYTITIDSGNALIKNSGGWAMKFNTTSNQMRFRFYDPTKQTAVSLYKLQA